MEGMNGDIGDNMFVVSKHVPNTDCSSWGNDNYKDYFGIDCIEHFVKDLLDIESKYKIKINKPLVFITEG